MCGRGVFAMGVVLVLCLGNRNEVSSSPIPEPDPCIFRIDLHNPHTTTTTTTTTAAPATSAPAAEAKSLDDKKASAVKEFEKFLETLVSWSTTTTTTTTAAPEKVKFKTFGYGSDSSALTAYLEFLIWPFKLNSFYPEVISN